MVTVTASRSRRLEQGTALLVAMVALTIVASAAFAVATLIQGRIDSFRMLERDLRLDALVDSAMAESLAGLSLDRSFRGVPHRTFGNGTISSEITSIDRFIRQIAAEARLEGRIATIEATVDVRSSRPKVIRWIRRKGPG